MSTIKLPFPLEDSVKEWCATAYPDYSFVSGRGLPSGHPKSHIARAVYENEAYRLAHQTSLREGFVVNVGGKPSRDLRQGRTDVFSLCPIAVGGDEHRNSTDHVNSCHHKLRDCTCIRAIPVKAFLAVHSAYYFNADEMGMLAYSGLPVYIVDHDYAGFFGDHYGEMRFETEFSPTPKVRVYRPGCLESIYSHHIPPYQLLRVFATSYGNATTTVVASDGHTRILRLTPSSEPCQPLFQSIDGRDNNFGARDDIVFLDVSPPVIAPRAYFDHLCLSMSYAKRTDTTRLDTLARLAKIKAKEMLVGRYANDRMRIIEACVAAAYATRVDHETTMLNRYTKPIVAKRWFGKSPAEKLDDALAMRTDWSNATYLAAGSAAMFALYTFPMLRSKYTYGIALAPFAIAAYDRFLGRPDTPQDIYSAAIQKFNSEHTSSLVPHQSAIRAVRALATVGYESIASPKTQRPDATLVCDPFPEKRETFRGATHIGFAVLSRIPVVHAKTYDNEYLSVANRLLNVQNPVDDAVQAETLEFLDRVLPELFGKPFDDCGEIDPSLPYCRQPLYVWWNLGFPAAQRKRHDAACERIDSYLHGPELLPLDPNAKYQHYAATLTRELQRTYDLIITHRDIFTKTEKLMLSSERAIADKVVRAIQSVSAEANVLLGPSIKLIAERVKSMWAPGADIGVVWASGLTANDVGQWFNDVCEEHPFCNFVEGDYSAFDGSQQHLHFEIERMVYEYLGLPSHARHVFNAQSFTIGVTRKFFRISVRWTRKSGDPNTGLGNSIENALFWIKSAQKVRNLPMPPPRSGLSNGHYIRDMRLRLIVLGDDMLQVDDCDMDTQAVQEYQSRMGLQLKIKTVSPQAASFCSGLFLPCQSVEDVPTHVLVPKPGTLLAKVGWSATHVDSDARDPWMRAVVNGLLPTTVAIPFIGQLLQQVCRTYPKSDSKIQQRHNFYSTSFVRSNGATWSWFSDRYGLSRDDLTSWEKYVRTLPVGPSFISHRCSDTIIRIDDPDVELGEDYFM